MQEDRLHEFREIELQKWRSNQLDHNIGRESITLTDIIQGYAIQRATLIAFLSEYADTAASCAAIALKIEEEYSKNEKDALDVIEEVAAEKQTRLSETSQELEEHRERIEELIAHAPDAVVVIDEENIIRLWNPKAEAIFGWREEEAVGLPLAETIVPPASRAAHNSGMARYVSTGIARVLHQTLSLSALHRDGHEFPISLTISAFRQGGKRHFVSFIRDVTEQRSTEAALESHRKQLEVRAEELEQYAWLVSHDLKEPLRKISMFADILEKRFSQHLPEEGLAYVQRMTGSTQRMSSLIDAVLAYANVSRVVEEKVPVSLSDTLAEATTNLELLIAETGARITVQSSLPSVRGIRVQLVQVFENLLANAMKYRKPDVAPEISVDAEKTGGRVLIRVRDNAMGFDQQYAEKIFAPFQRLHTREAQAGTGIGLALCRKIIEGLGGHIWAESRPGVGSTFMMELPSM
jgi:PAS domain S-box-containing protein